jgi:LuxR family maltose regulon positive regulatory protein
MDYCREGDELVVWKLDRFGRSLRELIDQVNELREGGVEFVSFVLELLPENVHLIVSGRADPPLPLARLRARGQMSKLGAAELAFTEDEAGSFLKGVMALDPSAEDVAKLEGRTEGWIAGLQLGALSTRGREDVSGFVESFSGGNRDVLDFLDRALPDLILTGSPES